jgi:hypothetical protein
MAIGRKMLRGAGIEDPVVGMSFAVVDPISDDGHFSDDSRVDNRLESDMSV